jgi:2,5-diamino-6-(ribosylamino)-4(3H)-pyrimidinone 5'-phosphate reductase
VREGLVDFVDVVVAPLLVGGRDTPTLVDGPSLASVGELSKLRPLELLGCESLQDSYMRLRYRVK